MRLTQFNKLNLLNYVCDRYSVCIAVYIVIIPSTGRFCCAPLINKILCITIYYNAAAAADTQMGKIVSSTVEW